MCLFYYYLNGKYIDEEKGIKILESYFCDYSVEERYEDFEFIAEYSRFYFYMKLKNLNLEKYCLGYKDISLEFCFSNKLEVKFNGKKKEFDYNKLEIKDLIGEIKEEDYEDVSMKILGLLGITTNIYIIKFLVDELRNFNLDENKSIIFLKKLLSHFSLPLYCLKNKKISCL